ncbi:MAG: ferric reductase-like transmembrane domain-containing protein [Acidimicrobiales bacterium]
MKAILAATDPKLAWYIARSSGLVAWVVVTASILWGLTLSTRLIRRRGVPAWLLDLHRFLGGLSVVFSAVHLLALVADNYVHFGLRELFVPYATNWRPGSVAWGIVALYVLVAVEVTSLMMKRMPRKVWRAIHASSFFLFIAATAHGLTSGADRTNLVVQWATLSGLSLVVFLTLYKFYVPKPGGKKTRDARAAVSRAAG